MNKQAMITDILQAIKAGGCYMAGDILLALVFKTETELKLICAELYIKTKG